MKLTPGDRVVFTVHGANDHCGGVGTVRCVRPVDDTADVDVMMDNGHLVTGWIGQCGARSV